VAALGGRHAARHIAAFLREPSASSKTRAAVRIEVARPLTWIVPSAIDPARTVTSRNCFVLRSEGHRRGASIEVRQDGRRLARTRTRTRTRLGPARSITLSAGWVADVDPAGGAVLVTAR